MSGPPDGPLRASDWAARCGLDWPGTWNARDLGSVRTAHGLTLSGRLVRSESLHLVDDVGWDQIVAYGVRSLIDLRDPAQIEREPQSPPHEVMTIEMPLEDGLSDEPEFRSWATSGWLGTPLYYRRFVERWPDRCAKVVEAFVEAPDGGVILHCGKGSARTGLLAALILEALGADRGFVVEDYLLTASRLRSDPARRLGRQDDAEKLRPVFSAARSDPETALVEFLDNVDPVAVITRAGLSTTTLAALQRRLLGSPLADHPSA